MIVATIKTQILDLIYVQRIKSNQIQKLLREEKDVLTEQVATLQAQVEAQNMVVRSLEEKERVLQNNLAIVEKEQGYVFLCLTCYCYYEHMSVTTFSSSRNKWQRMCITVSFTAFVYPLCSIY